MYARKRNYIIYASTCTEYVYETCLKWKRIETQNEKELNGKQKMKMENTK